MVDQPSNRPLGSWGLLRKQFLAGHDILHLGTYQSDHSMKKGKIFLARLFGQLCTTPGGTVHAGRWFVNLPYPRVVPSEGLDLYEKLELTRNFTNANRECCYAGTKGEARRLNSLFVPSYGTTLEWSGSLLCDVKTMCVSTNTCRVAVGVKSVMCNGLDNNKYLLFH